MKVALSYDDLKRESIKLANSVKHLNFDEVIAISRGGLTIAHIIAKELKLPVGIFFPPTNGMQARMYPQNINSKKYLIVEDLVAEGRTLDIIDDYFSHLLHYRYLFLPFLVDANYTKKNIEYYAMKTSDWIVFPWENNEKMNEGDRGLFRDGTDTYGQ